MVVEALSHAVPVTCSKGVLWTELETQKCGWWIDIGAESLVRTLQEVMLLDNKVFNKMEESGQRLVKVKKIHGVML